MRTLFVTVMGVSAFALSACGSHSPAPIVYGDDATHTARIYQSPEAIERKQRLERAQASQRPQAIRAVATADQPATLTPVSAIYLDEPERAAAPQRLAVLQEPAPATHLHEAKGFVEVQPGDTVYAIGRRHGVTPAAIIAENNLKKPYHLSVGQAIKLPKGAVVATNDTPTGAPAALSQPVKVSVAQIHKVAKGDTLYSIATKAGLSVDEVAAMNKMRKPYTLSIGQELTLPQTSADSLMIARATPTQDTSPREAQSKPATLATKASYTTPPANAGVSFAWPVRGKIVSDFGSGDLGRRNDGVNIAAPAGTAVRAAADGEVVYRGSELDGFGNLLLVKHAGGYVTAYAHNDTMLVKKGQRVNQGQIIAKVGQTGAVSSPQLHFEIRENLQSVDPEGLLGSQ